MSRRNYSNGDGRALASRLRRRVRIETPVEVSDGMGGTVRNWQLLAEAWAEISPLRGREALAQFQLESQISHRIVLRWRANLDASMRVVHGGRVFNIRAVLNVDEADRVLEVLADEGGAV